MSNDFQRSLHYALVDREAKRKKGKQSAARYFKAKDDGTWVEHGCDLCGAGMHKHIYDFQREHRPEGTICGTCSRKADNKLLKTEGI